MHLPTLFLLLFWLSGYSTAENRLTGPGAARGPERGSLTVQCRYEPGWENYRKWWCRGAHFRSCRILVMTTGSEQEVKKDRVSIRDRHKNHTFTVTMEELRRDDADTYWCGMERTGIDPGVRVEVTIDPALVTLEKTASSPMVTSYQSGNRAPRSEGSQAANHRPSGHEARHHEAQRPPSPHLCHIAASLGGRLAPGLEDGETQEERIWVTSRAGVTAPGG
ncbi:CMRF35-like molecule 1 isoform X7 [Microcebus murinus]|uniref:CMRF35-like molecule 1 isoform X7 n=1 Tax=Microcebus murinus TaxID=30608 RepID=UPI003F6BB077